jgi:hypothetical protein
MCVQRSDTSADFNINRDSFGVGLGPKMYEYTELIGRIAKSDFVFFIVNMGMMEATTNRRYAFG